MKLQVRSLALLSGLRIQRCGERWCRLQTRLGSCISVAVASGYSSNLTPSLGISISRRCGPQKREEKKKRMMLALGFCFCFCLFMATLAAYGGSQARGQIGAVAAGLHHSHTNVRSELHLQPTSQLTAMLDP